MDTIDSHNYCRKLAGYIDKGVGHEEAFLDMIDINVFDYIQGEYEQCMIKWTAMI